MDAGWGEGGSASSVNGLFAHCRLSEYLCSEPMDTELIWLRNKTRRKHRNDIKGKRSRTTTGTNGIELGGADMHRVGRVGLIRLTLGRDEKDVQVVPGGDTGGDSATRARPARSSTREKTPHNHGGKPRKHGPSRVEEEQNNLSEDVDGTQGGGLTVQHQRVEVEELRVGGRVF